MYQPNIIKNYPKVHPQNASLSFAIKRMEDIYHKVGGKADEPHRHDYYTILLVKSGEGKHIIDFNEFPLAEKQLFFVSPGQIHQIIEERASFGCVLTFSTQFMLENSIEKSFIENLHLFNDFGYSPPLIPEEEEFNDLIDLAESMYEFAHSDMKFRYQAVGALLKLLLIRCNNSCILSKEDNTQTAQASVILLRNFKDHLEDNYKTWHKVQDYANALHISSDYLNASIKSLTGKSAKEHIQIRITLAAKRLLRFSDFATKEIAYELGFSEPANFSQFFKKQVGISPSKFKIAA